MGKAEIVRHVWLPNDEPSGLEGTPLDIGHEYQVFKVNLNVMVSDQTYNKSDH